MVRGQEAESAWAVSGDDPVVVGWCTGGAASVDPFLFVGVWVGCAVSRTDRWNVDRQGGANVARGEGKGRVWEKKKGKSTIKS